MKVNISGAIKHSSVNGPGIRYVLFMQGCPHRCKGCQNPETHSLNGGITMDTKDIIKTILETKYIDGVTLSGGDPFMQPEATLEIIKSLKEKNINIWIYTGYLYESLISKKEGRAILNYADVLVDGKFKEKLLSNKCIYRGSSNQRLIDVKKSLLKGKIVIFVP